MNSTNMDSDEYSGKKDKGKREGDGPGVEAIFSNSGEVASETCPK